MKTVAELFAEFDHCQRNLFELQQRIAVLSHHIREHLSEKPELLPSSPRLRDGSEIAMIRQMILHRKAPMHLSEILQGLSRPVDAQNAGNIAGSLSTYIKRGIFTRPQPNFYFLKELEEGHRAMKTAA